MSWPRAVACCALASGVVGCGSNVFLSPDDAGGGAPSGGAAASGGDGGGSAIGPGGDGGVGAGGGIACGADRRCVPPPGDGVLVRVGEGDCPTGWQPNGAVFEGAQPGCPACSCGAHDGGCWLTTTRYEDASCQVDNDGPDVVAHLQCVNVDPQVPPALGLSVMPLGLSVGCPPSNDPVVPPPQHATRCGLSVEPLVGACADGEVCIPEPGNGSVCVLIEGTSATCPSGYETPIAGFATAQDNRVCSCSCGEGSADCLVGVALFAAPGCAQPLANVEQTTCSDIGAVAQHQSFLALTAFVGGACEPLAESAGQIDYADAVTLCCP